MFKTSIQENLKKTILLYKTINEERYKSNFLQSSDYGGYRHTPRSQPKPTNSGRTASGHHVHPVEIVGLVKF